MLLLVGGIYWADGRWTGGVLSAGLLGLLGIGAVMEYAVMVRGAGVPIARAPLLLATAALHGSVFLFDWTTVDREAYPLVAVTLGLLIALAVLALRPGGIALFLEQSGATLLGFVLVAWPMYMGQGLVLAHLGTALFVVLVCKGGDIGAYLTGISMGRHKLIPHVSPGKTIEGALGSLVVSCVLAVVLREGLLAPRTELTLTAAILVGIMLNISCQVGDLVESLLKRRCNVKDSSKLLPAHGGVLDLTDSLLLAFPMYLILDTAIH
jgi:phosphatidate cytidylyltransferase